MMRKTSFSFVVMLACMAVWTLVGCHDDDEHVRDQPDGVYYEQPQNQNQYDHQDNNSYDDHREYHGGRGWSVEIYRHGDDDDHDDDDHDHHDWDDDHDHDHHRHHGHDDHDDDDHDDDDD